MIAHSKDIGDFFLNNLKEIQNSNSIVKYIRGRGLMLAIELNKPNITEVIFKKMLEKGFFIGATPAWNVLRFYPAITISKEDVLSMCKALDHVLHQL